MKKTKLDELREIRQANRDLTMRLEIVEQERNSYRVSFREQSERVGHLIAHIDNVRDALRKGDDSARLRQIEKERSVAAAHDKECERVAQECIDEQQRS